MADTGIMESFVDWLQTPQGSEVTHAVILLVVAVAGYIQYRTHAVAADAKKSIDTHVEMHGPKGVLTPSESTTPKDTPLGP